MLIVTDESVWVESLILRDNDLHSIERGPSDIAEAANRHRVVVISSSDPTAAISLCYRLRPHFDGALVIFTDVTDEMYQRHAYAAGADEIIVKPITMSLLAAKLSSWQAPRAKARQSP